MCTHFVSVLMHQSLPFKNYNGKYKYMNYYIILRGVGCTFSKVMIKNLTVIIPLN